MRLFFDTEFTGLRKNTTLISIGIVAEDGRQFYAELTDYNLDQCDDWIRKNVLRNLYNREPLEDQPYVENFHIGDKKVIGLALRNWLKQFDYVQFVSDVCHYDFVLLIDLFGEALNLPNNVNPACHDINQDIARYLGISEVEAFNFSREELVMIEFGEELPETINKHNALYDAKVIRAISMKLDKFFN